MSGATIGQIKQFINRNPHHFSDSDFKEELFLELDKLACLSGYLEHLDLLAILPDLTQEIEDIYENDC